MANVKIYYTKLTKAYAEYVHNAIFTSVEGSEQLKKELEEKYLKKFNDAEVFFFYGNLLSLLNEGEQNKQNIFNVGDIITNGKENYIIDDKIENDLYTVHSSLDENKAQKKIDKTLLENEYHLLSEKDIEERWKSLESSFKDYINSKKQ
jgi:hypothetical protein